ncbi:SGNH/GDSL hydrolase family protein [Microbacterium sp. NPDC080220]|uniref:SGNH/GDSL hydrolase family protein n=1 Tax=Microbacterium sp. NPDC080220 TaxID=3161017 RepID=UPI00341D4D81
MAWPDFVVTREVTSGPSYTLEDGTPLKTRLTVTASRSFVWDATGVPFTSEEHQVTSALGVQASLFLPVTDQAGWRDDQNNLIDVSVPDTFTHTYRIVRELLDEKNRVVKGSRRDYVGVVVPTGAGAIDVDLMLPTETVEGARVSIPDTWSADVAAAAESAQVASDSATSAAEYASAAAEAAGDAAAAVAPVAAKATALESLTTTGRLGEAGLSATIAGATDLDTDQGQAFALAFRRHARTRRVWAIGDSITDQGVAWASAAYGADANVARRQGGLWQNNTAWTTWATLASAAKWTLAGISATAGFTPAQILATHVPNVIAVAQPGDTVVVLAGTNGAGTAMEDIPAIHAALRAAGLHTVAVTTPPRNSAPSTPQTLNTALRAWADSEGVPVADVHAALVDVTTGGYRAGLDNGDGVHPSEAGAKILGETIAATLAGMFASAVSPLVPFNAAATNHLQTKPLAIDTPAVGTDFLNLTSVGSGTFLPGTFSAAKGGMGYVATRGDVDINGRFGTYALVAGHKYRLGMMFDLALGEAGTFFMRLDSNTGATAATLWAMGYHTATPSGKVLARSVADRRFYSEFTVPPGFGDTYRLRFTLAGAGSVAKFSEITVADLTALGVA